MMIQEKTVWFGSTPLFPAQRPLRASDDEKPESGKDYWILINILQYFTLTRRLTA
jgi:hypothetical protein